MRAQNPPNRAGSAAFVELVRLVVTLAFTALGYGYAKSQSVSADSGRVILGAVLGSAIGYVLGGVFGRRLERIFVGVERRFAEIDGADMVAGGIGLIATLFVTGLFFWPVLFLPNRIVAVSLLAFALVVAGFLGFRAGITKREDLLQLFGLSWRTRAGDLRVMDTSAILDPRLLDAVRSGFLRGPMIVPSFVLEEVQSIADAGDPIRRARGRRGLETLSAMGRERLADFRVVSDRTFPEYSEVDAKVIALARERGAAIVTNDTAMARIAEMQGIEVLSLNTLAEALRAPVLAGEELSVQLIKEGREPGQGVGYLDDGTMVVVEGGRAFLGSEVRVAVTSVLQTSGGRMVFARQASTHAQTDSA
ncbi:MAG: PIN/TRAM domain-containing protein [Actinomycetota bacterium]|nr:TRAM domain-containing protein [Actinomycetota bacterium]